jgi:hypothetical protein
MFPRRFRELSKCDGTSAYASTRRETIALEAVKRLEQFIASNGDTIVYALGGQLASGDGVSFHGIDESIRQELGFAKHRQRTFVLQVILRLVICKTCRDLL